MIRLSIVVFTLLLPCFSFAASLVVYPKFQVFDDNGDPLASGKVWSYEPGGTSTPKALCADIDCNSNLDNPFTLDSRGEEWVYGQGKYYIVIKNSDETETILTGDDLLGFGGGAFGASLEDDYGCDLSSAITDLGSTDTTLKVDCDETVSSNLTVSKNTLLDFECGSVISVSSGYTLTFAGGDSIIDTPCQIFDGAGIFDGLSFARPEWWGAVNDDSTDTGAYITKAQNALSDYGVVLFGLGPYKVTATNGVETKDTITYMGHPSLTQISNAATITDEGNMLFLVQDNNNITIKNFRVTGDSGSTHSAVKMAGMVEYVYLENLELIDHKNHAIQYGDEDTSAATAYMRNIHLNGIDIVGTAQAAGSSGINFHPRSQDGSNEPASFNLFVDDVFIDISNSNNDVTQHGNTGFKTNNIDGVHVTNLTVKGGNVSGISLVQRTKNANLTNIKTYESDIGLAFSGSTSTVNDGETLQVNVVNYEHIVTDATGTDYSIYYYDPMQKISITNFYTNKDIFITGPGTGVALSELKFFNGILDGASFIVNDIADANIDKLIADNLTLIGGAGTGKGRMILGDSTRSIDNSIISNIIFKETDNRPIILYGNDNILENIIVEDGNPDSDASTGAIWDYGNRNSIDGLKLTGSSQNIDYFVRYEGDGGKIKNISGSPNNNQGFLIQNATTVPIGEFDIISGEIDLSGAASNPIYYYAMNDMYLLGVSVIYTEASSADAGVKIEIGNATADAHFFNKDSEVSKAIGYAAVYMNDTDFISRDVVKGEYISIGTVGGKTGTGAIKVIATLIKVPE